MLTIGLSETKCLQVDRTLEERMAELRRMGKKKIESRLEVTTGRQFPTKIVKKKFISYVNSGIEERRNNGRKENEATGGGQMAVMA